MPIPARQQPAFTQQLLPPDAPRPSCQPLPLSLAPSAAPGTEQADTWLGKAHQIDALHAAHLLAEPFLLVDLGLALLADALELTARAALQRRCFQVSSSAPRVRRQAAKRPELLSKLGAAAHLGLVLLVALAAGGVDLVLDVLLRPQASTARPTRSARSPGEERALEVRSLPCGPAWRRCRP